MKYIITGAAGWLGQNLVQELLTNGASHIRCLALPNEELKNSFYDFKQAEWILGDIRDIETQKKLVHNFPDATLIHLAGIIHPKSVSDFFSINTDASLSLLRVAHNAGLKRAVVMSSNSPVGCNPHPDHKFDESSPYNPYMNYGKSKMLMELGIKNFIKTTGMEVVVIRAPWFYGPGQPPRQTLFFSMIKNGKAPIVGNGNNLRSMSYVKNLSLGLRLASSNAKASGKTYWLADTRPYSMNEIVDTIEALLENDFKIKVAHKRLHLPDFASKVAYGVDFTLQSIGLYHQKIHVLSEMNKNIACSIDLACSELGYNPSIELKEGMRASIQWCLDQGHQI